MLYSQSIRSKTWVVDEVRLLEDVCGQLRELFIVASANHQEPAISTRKNLIRHDARMTCPMPGPFFTSNQPCAGHVGKTSYLRLKEIAVYPNAFPSLLTRQKSGEDSPMHVQACRDVSDSHSNLVRRAGGFASAEKYESAICVAGLTLKCTYICMSPASASIPTSYPGASRYGPVCP